jgi:hypothetical protein
MYKILLFSGGVYKFELLVEFIEDIGGLIVQEEHLHITRGSSFLSEEIRVMLIVPHSEFSGVRSIADDIKGNIEEFIIEETLKNNLINTLKIYNVLCKANDWLDQTAIKEMIDNSVEDGCFEIEPHENDSEENLEDCLELMISLKIIQKRENNGIDEYSMLKED